MGALSNVRELYHEECNVNFVYCVGALYNVRELYIMCGSFV